MPLVRISLPRDKPADFRRAISDGVHQAMVETINIPADDRFQVITEHLPSDGLVVQPSYLGIDHTPDCILVQITLRRGRTEAMKKALYARIADHLAERPGLRREDIIVCLSENDAIDWSFGNGIAQYVP